VRFSAAQQAALVAALGDQANINGVPFDLTFFGEENMVSLEGGTVVVSDPHAFVAWSLVDALGISGGSNGTVITVDAVDWRVLSVEKDESGLAVLRLGKVAY